MLMSFKLCFAAVFGQAAQAWKALSDEQRKAYMLMYAENSEDPALNNLPEAGGKPNPKAEAPTEKVLPDLDFERFC